MSAVVIITRDKRLETRLRRSLELAGLNPVVTGSVFMAAHIISNTPVEAILVDREATPERGVAICTKLRGRFGLNTPPMILVDNDDTPASKLVARAAGAECILKRTASNNRMVSVTEMVARRKQSDKRCRFQETAWKWDRFSAVSGAFAPLTNRPTLFAG
ncbi:MAG: response regulator transcription factor [Deltaproteobacteria bacterium]|nr:response regulator transcription factor [Deltaproteobacteria bacterium]